MTRGERVCMFIEKYLLVPDGALLGQRVKLEPFQRKFILAVYDNPKGTRRAYLSMGRKNGKGLALDTKVPTPSGWKTMGELRIGDRLFDENGAQCEVEFVSPVHIGLKCWRITFSDGTSVVADEQHRWLTKHKHRPWTDERRTWGSGKRTPSIVTTPQIAQSVRVPRPDGVIEFNHGIACAGALRTSNVELPLDPYLLGCWLGDGKSESATLYCGDEDIEHFARAVGDGLSCDPVTKRQRTCWSITMSSGLGGRRSGKFQSALRRAGVLGNKHIPNAFLWAGTEQRRALLQGLMDTDGTVNKSGLSGSMRCSFANTNVALAEGVLTLARSLGFKATLRTRDAKIYGRIVNKVHEVDFTAWREDGVFRLARKTNRLNPRPTRPTRSSSVQIVACDPVPSVPTVCIKVSSPSSLFLVGEGMVPTHNTALIAMLVLAHLIGPEAVRNSTIISGAQSREQAALVYELASKMVMMSAELRSIVRIVPSGKKLVGITRNITYHAISAEGKTAFGQSPILAILDEVGQVRGPVDNFVDAITTSQGAHISPLLIAISTQAPADTDLFSIWIDDAIKSEDKRIVCHLYTSDEDAALDDKTSWRASNPALGVFRSIEDVKEQAERALRMPSFEPTFRNLVRNERCEALAPFVAKGTWVLNSGDVDQSAFYEGKVYVGLDLSGRSDLTAAVLVSWKDDKWHVKPYFWTPEKGLKERARASRSALDVWAKQGFIQVVPGASIDYEVVAKDLVTILEDCDVAGVGFDRWRIELLKKELDEIKAPFLKKMVPFGQGYKDMSPALEAVETALLNERVAHGANPVLTMCAMNSRVQTDPAGNRKLNKLKAVGRIDGMVALCMAIGVANGAEVPKKFQAFFY